MFKIKVKGLDGVLKKLEKLSESVDGVVEDFNGEHQVNVEDLFSPGFVSSHTQFNSLDELYSASPLEEPSVQAFDDYEGDDLDAFISSNSDFDTWAQMKKSAVAEWAKDKIGQALEFK